jgi:phosphate transport system substrate-binding protein
MKTSYLGLSAILFACPLPAQCEEIIQIHGSDTMIHINEAWAVAYKRVQPEVQLDLKGGGSGIGLEELVKGEIEIAASSRPIRPAESKAIEAAVGAPPNRG